MMISPSQCADHLSKQGYSVKLVNGIYEIKHRRVSHIVDGRTIHTNCRIKCNDRNVIAFGILVAFNARSAIVGQADPAIGEQVDAANGEQEDAAIVGQADPAIGEQVDAANGEQEDAAIGSQVDAAIGGQVVAAIPSKRINPPRTKTVPSRFKDSSYVGRSGISSSSF
jgi:hypothetical protein